MNPSPYSTFAKLHLALGAAAAAELAVASARAPAGSLTWRTGGVYVGDLLLVTLVGSVTLTLVAAGVFRARRWLGRHAVPSVTTGFVASDWAAAGLLIAPPLLALGTLTILTTSRAFSNRELAALLATSVIVGLTLLGALAARVVAAAARAARNRLGRRGSVLSWLPGAVLTLGLLAMEVSADRTGARQLDPALLVVPSAAGISLLLLGRSRRFGAVSRRGAALLGAASLLTGALAALGNVSTAAFVGAYGAWSRPIVPFLRAATDVDGDGYSSWFGGADCAPWDARVHPGRIEVPENGIDDNCVAGDGSQLVPIEPPRASGLRVGRLPPKPHVVLVTIETLRADHVSFLGYRRPTTPRLDELAARSVVFERLYATTPTTRLSLPSLLAGVLPSRLDWLPQAAEKRMRRIGPRTPWLPELLAQQGYATIAVHTNFRAFTELESVGFDRGFAHYDTSTRLLYSGGTMRGFPGARQVDRALELVDAVSGRPFFLWVHLVEPHYEYEQPTTVPSFGVAERDRYDAEIREADRQVGRLLDGLRSRALTDDAILLVAGDHGEEFGEHGERWHTSNLYEPQVRTAGMLFVPGLPARRVRAAVSLTDFAPTLLDLLGHAPPLRRMHGRNLVPLLTGGEPGLAPFFLENFRVESGASYQVALVDEGWKLIYRQDGGSYELYDVLRDPAERHDVYAAHVEKSKELVTALMRFRESHGAP